MRIKAALHVHSTLSHDGTLTLAKLAELYRDRGYQLVAMGEHSQDMDREKIAHLIGECATHSGPGFLMLPGIEFSCRPEGLHILGIGATELAEDGDPVRVAAHVRASGGFCVLAHPSRQRWQHSRELVATIDAAEIWNIAYDGKFLPQTQALSQFRKMQAVNPGLLALAGHDLHRTVGYYDLGVLLEVESLTREQVFGALRRGSYRVSSRFFASDARGTASLPSKLSLGLFGGVLHAARKMRKRMR